MLFLLHAYWSAWHWGSGVEPEIRKYPTLAAGLVKTVFIGAWYLQDALLHPVFHTKQQYLLFSPLKISTIKSS